MKAVMYGGGNIGRGFIGMLFSASGFEVRFIDVAKPLIEEINRRNSYPVRILNGDTVTDITVGPVYAVDGNDKEAASAAIAEADIVATAVGVRILPYIVPNLVAGIRKRFAAGDKPLNILICENLNNANKILEGMLKEQLTPEECERFDRQIGLVEASIGRMVPIQTPEMQAGDKLRVCVEEYGFLPVDGDAFKGEVPPIKNMLPVSPFDFFLKRKLFLHNMGHAVSAYLGELAGCEYIWEAVGNGDIYACAQNAMTDSAMALSKRYGKPLPEILRHMEDLLFRFSNKALGDTCERVGREPERKLSASDRLVGARKLCREEGSGTAFLDLAIGAALHRYLREQSRPQTPEEAAKALKELSGEEIPEAIAFYEAILAGADAGTLRRMAEKQRKAALGAIV